jgi:hypothetical protein
LKSERWCDQLSDCNQLSDSKATKWKLKYLNAKCISLAIHADPIICNEAKKGRGHPFADNLFAGLRIVA